MMSGECKNEIVRNESFYILCSLKIFSKLGALKLCKISVSIDNINVCV